MEKEIREFFVEFDFYWQDRNEIDKIIEDLNKLKSKGATHLYIQANTSYDVEYLSFQACEERLETDKEFAYRLEEIKAREEHDKMNAINTINILKKRHGL